MLTIGQEVCASLEQAQRREWIVTNGLGGYASATIAGANSRRYHGLLVAATAPSAGRMVLLSKLEETLVVDGQRLELATNVYGAGVVHPQGYRLQSEFRMEPGAGMDGGAGSGEQAVFTFVAGGVTLEKRVHMLQGENTTVVEYSVTAQGAAKHVELELRPLVAFKDFHSCAQECLLDATVEQQPGLLRLAPYPGLPALWLGHDAAQVTGGAGWYRDFALEAERERGLDWREDLYNPVTLGAVLEPGVPFTVVASTERRSVQEVRAAAKPGSSSAMKSAAKSTPTPAAESRQEPTAALANLTAVLERAAEQFIVARPPFQTVIAGYHWFGDWGRDTMISLPGLLLARQQPEACREILLEFNKYVDGGMLPNRFPDRGGVPEYNTVDATLWFFEALWKYVHFSAEPGWRTAALALIRGEFYANLKSIVALHLSGTRYSIHADDEGFLWAGDESTQLTWMDARVGSVAITPRAGRPVEIQALWFNALLVLRDFALQFGEADAAAQYAGVAATLQANFERVFWNQAEHCLYDVAGANGWVDGAVRPNMAIAVSLTHCLLPPARVHSVLAMVEQDLLTPFGLRTLSPRDSRYIGRYQGDVWSRDGAYHQGTVWPWLAGPYFSAKLAFAATPAEAAAVKAEIAAWLQGFAVHLDDAGIGQVSEIFDGDAPWNPKGCIAQAWSVAELLRLAKLAAA